MSGSGGKSSSESTTQVDIPDFLRPLLEQGTGVASGALSNLENLAGTDLVAGFTPEQEEAFRQATEVAGGGGGFIPTAQQELLRTAEGRDISSFLPESSFSALSSSASGAPLESLLPPEALAALSSTAGGDFLFGGDGFNAAVDAAVRAATPSIASAFGGTAGGLSGGLARQAVGDTAVDAFARQFATERQNQLGAANTLAGITGNERGRALSAAGLLGSFGSAERGRQLDAVEDLPSAGLLGSNILSQVGGERQELEQARLRNPFENQLQLLVAALQGLPIQSLLGQTTEAERRGLTLNFGDQ